MEKSSTRDSIYAAFFLNFPAVSISNNEILRNSLNCVGPNVFSAGIWRVLYLPCLINLFVWIFLNTTSRRVEFLTIFNITLPIFNHSLNKANCCINRFRIYFAPVIPYSQSCLCMISFSLAYLCHLRLCFCSQISRGNVSLNIFHLKDKTNYYALWIDLCWG